MVSVGKSVNGDATPRCNGINIIIIIIIITALHTNNGECCEMIRRCRVVV